MTSLANGNPIKVQKPAAARKTKTEWNVENTGFRSLSWGNPDRLLMLMDVNFITRPDLTLRPLQDRQKPALKFS